MAEAGDEPAPPPEEEAPAADAVPTAEDSPAADDAPAAAEAPAETPAGDADTPAETAEGGPVPDGDAAPPAEGDAAAVPAEGEAAVSAEGNATATEGEAAAAAEGEATATVDGDAPPAEGDAEPQTDGDAAAAPTEGGAGDGEQGVPAEGAEGAEGAAAPTEGGEAGDGAGEAAQSGEGGEGEGGEAAAPGGDAAPSGEAGGPGSAPVELNSELTDAAVKIQSMARSKASRERVQRIKMGEEDAFVGGSDKVRKAKKTADGAAAEGDGEGEASLEESMEGGAAEKEGDEGDEVMDDAEAKAAAELKAREEKARLEAEARQARVNERLEISKKYAAAQQQKEALLASNADLQRKLAAHLAQKRNEEAAAAAAPEESAEVSQGDMETRYFQSLRQVADNRAELEKVQQSYDHMVLDMKTRLEQKQEKVRELKVTYSEVKTSVALGTSGHTTGRLIPTKLLKQLEEQAGEKEVELEKVRLKNIHLRNQLRKLEGNLRRKEELSNELHLIDFEQLKIENQTLNEKIEERNEELLKLRKKTTTTVQVLTHLKEKLQFVQAENQLLKVELAELEAELSTHRDALTRAKHDRDSLRSENLRLRGEAGLIGNNDLLRDFDRRKKDIASMQVTLEGLKGRHRTLREQVVTMSAKALQAQY